MLADRARPPPHRQRSGVQQIEGRLREGVSSIAGRTGGSRAPAARGRGPHEGGRENGRRLVAAAWRAGSRDP